MTDQTSCPAVKSTWECVNGALVFCEYRVPIASLFENLEDRITIKEFIEIFPELKREQQTSVYFCRKN